MTSQTDETFEPYIGDDGVKVGPKLSIAFNVLVERNLIYMPDEEGAPQGVVSWRRDEGGVMLPWHMYLPQGRSSLHQDLQGLGLIELAVKFHEGLLQRFGSQANKFQIFRVDDNRPTSYYSYYVFVGGDAGGAVLLHQDGRTPATRTDDPIWDLDTLMGLEASPEAVWSSGPEVDYERRAADFQLWRAEGKIIFTDESAYMRAFTALQAQHNVS